MADETHAARVQRRPRLPRRKEILDHGEELLLGRIPRLEQVIVERHLVDRRDRRLGVRVCRQEHALGVGHEPACLHEVLSPRHPRHSLVGDEHGHLIAARPQLAQNLERLGPRGRTENAEPLAEASAQIA